MKEESLKRLIVVLGMHRSGTSAVTRGLKTLGVRLGSHLMSPVPGDNDKGFWEDVDLNKLNIDFLHFLHQNWHDLAPVEYSEMRHHSMASFKLSAIEILRYKLQDSSIFGWKDPRTCRLLPFWKSVFEHLGLDVSYVIVSRHPMSVARSLKKRNGFDAEKSYYLWLEHMVPAMLESNGCRRVVVDYDLLIESPGDQLRRIADQLALPMPGNAATELFEYSNGFLEQQLRHTRFRPEDLLIDPTVPQELIDAYEILRQLACDQFPFDTPVVQEAMLRLKRWLESNILAFRYMSKLDGQLESVRQTAADREARITLLEETLADRHEEVARLRQAVADGEDRNKVLKQMAADRDAQITTLNQMKVGYQQQIGSLNAELGNRLGWALELEKELRQAEGNIRAIYASKSWKITYPLRAARRLLGRPLSSAGTELGLIWRLARRTYRALPLSSFRKQQIKGIFYSTFPGVFAGLTSFQVWKTHHRSIGIPSALAPGAKGRTPTASSAAEIAEIVLPTSPNPVVSVIIPVYGYLDYTLRCLRSFAFHPPHTPLEIIVVNDCSPDSTQKILELIDGLTLILNDSNQGFLRSCNLGAGAARGEFLCFLNNDTEITSNWLDELVRTFEEFPGTGLVGSKLVYPDGRLQEAGGIIWRDASAWNFGRGHNPDLPVFNYAREVDYCSAASIMVPKQVFEKVGGFDERYLPAYCEDADLALKIRSDGLRVIYQPLSVVIHYEGVTSGTDTSSGVKAHQVRNAKQLFERWRETLATRQAPGQDLDRAKDRAATRRVLVIDHCTPTPDQDAGSITTFNIMLLLRDMGFQVTFIPEDNFLFMPDYTPDLQRCGIEALYGPFVNSVAQHLKEWGERYDLIVIFRPLVAERYLGLVRKHCPRAKVVYHTIDLHYLRKRREAELARDDATYADAERMRKVEFRVIHECDAVIVHSMAEKEILKENFPESKLWVFPLVMSVKGTEVGFTQRSDIVFIGGYQHRPNVDAVKYFVKDIFPLIRQRIPGVCFFAVGSNPPAELNDIADKNCILTGFVEDLAPLLDRMRVAVAPLRYGAGIKGKIGTTMSMGVPCVATKIAVEGMGLVDGEHVLVADDPMSFANAVAELYTNELLWKRLHREGLAFADCHYGARAAWAITRDILGSLGFDVSPYKEGVRLIGPGDNRKNRAGMRASKKLEQLRPVAICRTQEEFKEYLASEHYRALKEIEDGLIKRHSNGESYTLEGYCEPCGKKSRFFVDMLYCEENSDHDRIPNWRERLVCPFCKLNNRQRLIATLMRSWIETNRREPATIYMMEFVTPIFEWARREFHSHKLEGSEYLGPDYAAGEIVRGIRHEDVQQLGFGNESIDLIVSNDVIEHVPDPERAFAECARVLRATGELLMTVPFYTAEFESVRRANLEGGKVRHLLPAIYHGNPISEKGSLVFSDFGWDMLKIIQGCGFSDARAEIYVAPDLGHLGGGQIVFRATKLSDWGKLPKSLLPSSPW